MKTVPQKKCKSHYCTLAALSPVGICHTDIEGHYVSVNDRWCEIAGISLAEALRDGWAQALHSDDKERVLSEWYRAVHENLPFQTQYRFQRPDGTITWVLGQALAEKDATGVVTGYVGIITDSDSLGDSFLAARRSLDRNTSRQQTEEELKNYCQHLEELVQERTAELLQVKEQLRQEIADRKRVEQTQARLVASLEATPHCFATGDVNYISKCQGFETQRRNSEKLPVKKDNGEMVAGCSMAQNITEFKQAEEKLALRNRELLTLHRISEIHLSTQSLKATFNEIVEEISAATGFPIVAIELYDEARQMMVFEAMKGVPLPANSSVLEVPADQTLSGTVARTGQPVIKIYAPLESKNCDSNETLKQLGIKTFICMPMLVKGRAIGTLSLAHPEVVHLDEYLPQWIASLANYIASLSEHKRAQTELKKANERFELAAAAINCLIYDWDIEKNQIQRTQGLVNLLGYHPEEAEPTPEWWRDRIHPDDWQRLQPLASAPIGNEDTYAVEYRIRNKENQYLYVWDHGLIVRDANGRAVRAVGSTMDITQRKQAEQALHDSERRLTLALKGAKAGSWELNWATYQGVWSDENFKLLGYEPGSCEVHYNNWLKAIHPEDRERADRYVKQVMEENSEFALEYRVLLPDNTVRWLRAIGTITYDERGNQTGMIGIQIDITDRKQMEEALRHQFARAQLEATIAQRIHQSLNLEEILHTTVGEARKFLASDRVLIYRFRADGSGVVVVESVGADWRPISGTIIHDCCFTETYAQLYQKGRVQAVEDIYTANLTQCHVDLLAQFQVKANLVVPIVQEEELWGLLVAHQCSRTRPWQPLEIDLLKSLATQAAIAIQKSELYEHAQAEITQRQQVETALRLQFLREQLVGAIAQRIRRSLNLEEILNTTVTEVRQFLACDRVIVFRFEPDWSGIVTVESVEEGCTPILGTNIYDPCFEASHVQPYREGRVKAIPDIYTAHLSKCHINLLAQFHVRANLVVPILEGENLWGLLIAHHCREPRQWQQFEMDLLKSLATQLAIALQQSELYQQSRAATATALTQAKQLEQALQELQRTQAQLVQSEKMSSLGQLVAGVAHEINNPVSFIYGNLIHANNYTQDILGLLDLYQEYYPNPVAEISSEIEAIELDFVVEDLPKLLDSMKVGAERICEIVAALRNFSRLAEAEIKAVDLHEGLDSTLTILQNRLRAHGQHPEIQVIKQYGNLPKVECYPGQLNQVFMNIISNAIDALEELNVDRLNVEGLEGLEELNVETLNVEGSQQLQVDRLNVVGDREVVAKVGASAFPEGVGSENNLQPATPSNLAYPSGRATPNGFCCAVQPANLQPATPCLRITTEVIKDNQVAIRIADNGSGMSEQVKARIFDPFYTTKPVGSGTGLGLSISYQIVVEKHGGQLYCLSEPGRGTEFVIQIPLWKKL